MLQVPYDAPPTPITGASVERSASGVTIRPPSTDPETAWRTGVQNHLWGAGVIGGFLGIYWAICHGRAFFVDEVGSTAWQPSVFLLACIPLVATIFCSIALAEFLNKKKGVQLVAARTLVALAVRSGALYRCYHSGREESWPARDIATVHAERVGKCDQVHLHLKAGTTVHLFGSVPDDERHKLQHEGMTWLAQQPAVAPGLIAEAPVPSGPILTEAVRDFATRDPMDSATRKDSDARDKQAGIDAIQE